MKIINLWGCKTTVYHCLYKPPHPQEGWCSNKVLQEIFILPYFFFLEIKENQAVQWNTWNLLPEKSTCLSACVWKWEGLEQIALLKSKKCNLIEENICSQTRLWMKISFSGVWIWRSMLLSKCSWHCQGTDLHVASSPKFEAHSFLHLKPKDMPRYIIPYYSQTRLN